MTDTGKWDKKWFRSLKPQVKLLWIFLCDRCDQAGVWDADFETASYFIGAPVTKEDMVLFGDRVKQIGENKWWLTTFIDFQCVNLSRQSPAHTPVFKLIDKHQLPYQSKKRVTQTVDEILHEIMADDRWVEVQCMNHKVTPAEIEAHFRKCHSWHIEKPHPPEMFWEWRQKLVSWITINNQHDGGRKKPTAGAKGLAESFIKRHGSTLKGEPTKDP